jgi:hypothetical protein
VQNVCGVDIFQATESLVDERLEVSISQRLAGTDLPGVRCSSRTRQNLIELTIACRSASMSSSCIEDRIIGQVF